MPKTNVGVVIFDYFAAVEGPRMRGTKPRQCQIDPTPYSRWRIVAKDGVPAQFIDPRADAPR
jgi:hypothetical protein